MTNRTRVAAVCICALTAAGAAKAQLTAPPPAITKEILHPGGLIITKKMVDDEAKPLLAALTPDEQRKLGALNVVVDDSGSSATCASDLQLAFSFQQAGRTTVTFCGPALRALWDNNAVATIFPFQSPFNFQDLMTHGDTAVQYTIIQLAAVTKQKTSGKLTFPLLYCSPFVFLSMVASKGQTCSGDEATSEKAVIDALDSSALLSSILEVNKKSNYIAPDVRSHEYVALMLALIQKAAVDFLLAHELNHYLCGRTCSEKDIDVAAFDLIYRSVGAGLFGNMQAVQMVQIFSSVFSSQTAIFDRSMNAEARKREIIRRESAIACVALTELEDLTTKHRKEFDEFAEKANAENPLLGSLTEGNMAILKLTLSAQCKMAK